MAIILQNQYVLAVHNVRESAQFYVDRLGFKIIAQPPGWIFVARDGCVIMLGECPNDMHPSELGCHNYFAYLKVDDVDAWQREMRERGMSALNEPVDQSWGMREFGIKTPDGHRIMFGQSIGNPPKE